MKKIAQPAAEWPERLSLSSEFRLLLKLWPKLMELKPVKPLPSLLVFKVFLATLAKARWNFFIIRSSFSSSVSWLL